MQLRPSMPIVTLLRQLRDGGTQPIAENARNALESVEHLDVLDNPSQRVVVVLRNRVEFVVVTARAAKRQSKERTPDLVDLVVDDIHPQLSLELVDEIHRPQRDELRRDDVVSALGVTCVRQEVPSDLLNHKTIEGLVLIKRPDDVVTIAPGTAVRKNSLDIERVGVLGEI